VKAAKVAGAVAATAAVVAAVRKRKK
jgi:hypothetical protein